MWIKYFLLSFNNISLPISFFNYNFQINVTEFLWIFFLLFFQLIQVILVLLFLQITTLTYIWPIHSEFLLFCFNQFEMVACTAISIDFHDLFIYKVTFWLVVFEFLQVLLLDLVQLLHICRNQIQDVFKYLLWCIFYLVLIRCILNGFTFIFGMHTWWPVTVSNLLVAISGASNILFKYAFVL